MGGTLDLASIAGHHIPGTSYTYHHGWVMVGGVDEVRPGAIQNHPKFGRGVVRGSTGIIPVRNKAGKMVSDGKPPRVLMDFPGRKNVQFDVKSAHGHPNLNFGFHARKDLPSDMAKGGHPMSALASMGLTPERAAADRAAFRAIARRGAGRNVGVGAAEAQIQMDYSSRPSRVIDLDWASWDAEKGGGGGHGYGKMSAASRAKAHATAHASASASAKRHMASKGQRANANSGVRGFHAKSASQLKYGHNVVFGNKGQLEEHKVISVQHKPNGHVRLHTLGPGGKHHYQNMPANTQVSMREGGGLPQVLKQGGFAGQTPAGNPYGLANGGSHTMDFAGSQLRCPNCGYASDDADFSVSGGTAGTSDPGKGAALQTPQPRLPNGSGGTPLTVRGAGSPSMGLANGGRAIGLANRLPVRQPVDLLVSRSPSGSQIVRHRRGGGSIGELKHNDDGTWQSVVDGRDLTPHRQQRAALMEMVGMYNKTAGTPERAAQPLMPAPEQTPLMEQFGVPAIRLAADDSDSSDDTDTSGNGLTPRGQGIYKKLCGKGVSPKVAMAMAKRAQNTTAGSFGQKAS